jgi:preprotein translocase subunit SecE
LGVQVPPALRDRPHLAGGNEPGTAVRPGREVNGTAAVPGAERGRVSDTVGTAVPDRDRPSGRGSGERPGFGARIALFYRQIIAELRKVIWPTRRELITYTTVVIVFVTVVATIVAVLDLIFAKGVLKVFGGG